MNYPHEKNSDEIPEQNTVSFVGRSLRFDCVEDVKCVIDKINECQNLHVLNLEGNTLGTRAAEALGSTLAKRSTQIRHLLCNNLFTGRLKSEIPIALASLGDGLIAARCRLSVLDLSDNAIGPVGMSGLEKLLCSEVCFSLEELYLNNNGWGPTGGEMLGECLVKAYHKSCDSQRPMGLKIFISGRSRLEDVGAISLSKFFSLVKTLKVIAMPQNGIHHEGVEALCEAFRVNTGLTHIDLNDNILTEKGAECISQSIRHLPDLQVLNLNDCLIRDAGAFSICETICETNPSLVELHLGFNELTKSSGLFALESLCEKPYFTALEIDGNCFGDEGISEINELATELAFTDYLLPMENDEGECDNNEDSDREEDEIAIDGEEEEIPIYDDEDDEKSDSQSEPDFTAVQRFVDGPSTATFMDIGEDYCTELAMYANCESSTSRVDRHVQLLAALCACLTTRHACSVGARERLLAAVDSLFLSVETVCADAETNEWSVFHNRLLECLGLIKSEDKLFCVRDDLSGWLVALLHVVKQKHVHVRTQSTLASFLIRPNKTVDNHPEEKNILLKCLSSTV